MLEDPRRDAPGPPRRSAAVHTSLCPEETEALGALLARELTGGEVVLLSGDVGSGKTTFVRGAASALGVCEPVSSPTFAIAHRYRAGGRLSVAHLDLYRLGELAQEDASLLEDYLGADTIAFVEWPPANGELRASARFEVSFSHDGGDRRLIEVRG